MSIPFHSIDLSVCLSVYLSTYLYIYIYVYIYIHIHTHRHACVCSSPRVNPKLLLPFLVLFGLGYPGFCVAQGNPCVPRLGFNPFEGRVSFQWFNQINLQQMWISSSNLGFENRLPSPTDYAYASLLKCNFAVYPISDKPISVLFGGS